MISKTTISSDWSGGAGDMTLDDRRTGWRSSALAGGHAELSTTQDSARGDSGYPIRGLADEVLVMERVTCVKCVAAPNA